MKAENSQAPQQGRTFVEEIAGLVGPNDKVFGTSLINDILWVRISRPQMDRHGDHLEIDATNVGPNHKILISDGGYTILEAEIDWGHPLPAGLFGRIRTVLDERKVAIINQSELQVLATRENLRQRLDDLSSAMIAILKIADESNDLNPTPEPGSAGQEAGGQSRVEPSLPAGASAAPASPLPWFAELEAWIVDCISAPDGYREFIEDRWCGPKRPEPNSAIEFALVRLTDPHRPESVAVLRKLNDLAELRRRAHAEREAVQ